MSGRAHKSDPEWPPGVGKQAAHRASLAGSATSGIVRDLLQNPITFGYQEGDPRHEPSLIGKVVSVVVIAALTMVSVWAARDLQRARVGTLVVNQELIDDTLRRREVVNNLGEEIAALEAAIEERSLLLAPISPLEQERNQFLGAHVGSLPVRGEGIVIVIDDSDVQDPDGRVRDFDLQVVTNSLWAQGAEAIAINGERLTPGSALRSAGEAVLVNLAPLIPPYRVEAIGNSRELQVGLAQSRAAGHLAMLRDTYGVNVNISAAEQLELPGATQVVPGTNAVPIE